MAQNDAIQWHSLAKAQQMAKHNKKKVMIFAQAEWSVYCKKMKKKVFTRSSVVDSLKKYFYAVKLNVDSDASLTYNGKKITSRQFAQSHNVHVTPTIFFLNRKGSIIGSRPGYISAQHFSQLLGFMGSDAFRQIEFKTYLQKHAGQ